jgi:hypothetical protein
VRWKNKSLPYKKSNVNSAHVDKQKRDATVDE